MYWEKSKPTLKQYVEWPIKLILIKGSMNKTFRILPLFLLFAILSAKDKFSISGSVITLEGEGVKKAPILLLDSKGNKVKSSKSKKD